MKAAKGKYYQVGEKHVVKPEKNMLIETNEVVKTHTKITGLPKELKEKQLKKEKK